MPPPPPEPAQSQPKKVGRWVVGGAGFLAALATVGSFVYPTFINRKTTPVGGGCSSYRLPTTTNRLGLCDKGPRVTELQEDLSYLGYVVNVDSHFGTETRTAVNDFERLNALPINGQANAETLEAIRTAVRNRGGQPTIP